MARLWRTVFAFLSSEPYGMLRKLTAGKKRE
jgi:hypothetical protein